ncbi:MAG TPA: hypothetical protein VM325_00790 [Alphaproteobacteria bacterium]|nr:hypothetical protein [Alphaproteobacteria bacterium]
MATRRKDLIVLGAMVGGSAAVALGAWMAVMSVFSDSDEPISQTHASLCRSGAHTTINHTVPGVRGFVLRYPNVRELRSTRTEGGLRKTKRWSMSSRPCPGRCLVALMRGGYAYVENEEYAPEGGGLVGYRYTLKPLGHPNCMAGALQSPIDAEVRAAAAALAREGKRCLARAPAIELGAPFELSRSFKLERLGLSGVIVRVFSQVRRRAKNTVVAEQVTYLAFATEAMMKGGGISTGCPGRPGASGPARLLRPSDVLIAPGRPVRENAEGR